MKKSLIGKILISIVFAALGLLQSNAQIQRNFLGFTFGDSKQTVAQALRNKGYILDYDADGNGIGAEGTARNPIVFGGYEWQGAYFCFFNNKLYDVSFCISTYVATTQDVIDRHNQLVYLLHSKYAQYDEEISDQEAKWSDSNTGLICRYYYADRDGNIVNYKSNIIQMYLWYYDNNLTKLKWENNSSDL